ncbi:MAG: hypothetical protein QM619_10970 [Micropruina sp.]|uniref:hypothetical protein n=1 Tax=Micropruina sp. TaxID=2737536 RepID=UPI0039E6C9A5
MRVRSEVGTSQSCLDQKSQLAVEQGRDLARRQPIEVVRDDGLPSEKAQPARGWGSVDPGRGALLLIGQGYSVDAQAGIPEPKADDGDGRRFALIGRLR